MRRTYETLSDAVHHAIRVSRNMENAKNAQNAYLVIMRETCAAIRTEQPSLRQRDVLAKAAKRYAAIGDAPQEAETDTTIPTEEPIAPMEGRIAPTEKSAAIDDAPQVAETGTTAPTEGPTAPTEVLKAPAVLLG